MAGTEDEAAVKIQAIYRGNKGRDKAVQELEALMEAELEYAVTKAQASQGKAKRKDDLSMDMMEEEYLGDAPSIGSSAVVSSMGVNEANLSTDPTPDKSADVLQSHKVSASALRVNDKEINARVSETVSKNAPGLYKKKDLINHIKKLQERVADIQNIVGSVLPTVNGEAKPEMPAPSMLTRNFRATTNGRKLSELRVGVFGLGGVGAIAAEMLARSGVGALLILDHGKVEEIHVTSLYYQNDQLGLPRVDAAKLCVNDFSPQATVEAMQIDFNNEAERKRVKELFEMEEGASPLGGSLDIVLDCLEDSTQSDLLAELCHGAGITRLECGTKKEAACAYYQFHVAGAATEQAFAMDPVEDDAGGSLWEVLLPSTYQTIAGLAVQDVLKYLLEAGKVTSAVRYNTATMRVDSREMSF